MKKTSFTKSFLGALFMLLFSAVFAQLPEYTVELRNAVQTAPNELEFDIYISNTGIIPFEYSLGQYGILPNPAIKDGGLMTAVLVPGTSDLPFSNQPGSIQYHNPTNCIRISAKPPAEFCFIPPHPGLRVTTVRLTNSVPFLENSTPDLMFSFTSPPYQSVIACFQDVGGVKQSVVITEPIWFFDLTGNIVLNPTAPCDDYLINISDTICDDQLPYMWEGMMLPGPGIYPVTYPTTNPPGCDSTIVLDLVVIPTTTNTTTDTACDSYLWAVNGQTYTTTGIYTEVNGCHTEILDITIVPTPVVTCPANIDICLDLPGIMLETLPGLSPPSIDAASSFSGPGVFPYDIANGLWDFYTDIAGVGTHTITYTYDNGICSDFCTFEITVNPTEYYLTMDTICDDEVYTWMGNDYTVAGTYFEYGTTAQGCLITYELQLTVNSTEYYLTMDTICDDEVYTWMGNDYTMAGTYFEYGMTAEGCLITYELQLTVNPTEYYLTMDTICDGDIYTWMGNDYTVGGTYFEYGTTAEGCLITYELQLTVNPSTFNTTVISACDSYFWAVNGQTYTTTGIYTDVIDCHTEILDLTIVPTPVVTCPINFSVCEDNGTVFLESLPGLSPPSVDASSSFSGPGVFVANASNGWWDFEPSVAGVGTHTITYTYDNGVCSNSCTFEITVNPTEYYLTVDEICDGDIYTWMGNTYTVGGTYFEYGTTAQGCLITYELQLTVNPTEYYLTTDEICDGDIYTWMGNDYTVGGTYFEYGMTALGCLITYELQLTVNPTEYYLTTATINDGDIYTWMGNDYTVGGTYFEYGTTALGCLITYELQLTVLTPVAPFRVEKEIGTAVEANWDPIAGAVKYQIRYSDAGSGIYSPVAQTTMLKRKIVGLTPNTDYLLEIRYFDGAVWSSWDAYTPFIFNSGAVDFEVSYDIGTKFLVAWTDVTDASGYIFQWKEAGAMSWITRYPISNEFVMNTAASDTDYEFRVIVQFDGAGFWYTQTGNHTSNLIEFVTTNNGTSADFSWDAVDNPMATAYFLQIREIGTMSWFPKYTLTNSTTITDLDSLANYEYRLVVRYGSPEISWGATEIYPLAPGTKEVVTNISSSFNVYPNPVDDMMTVEINTAENANYIWNLYDVNGKLIMSGTQSITTGLNHIEIATAHLPAGLYLLQSNMNGNMMSSRIIKQ
jgi:hypothetical protein